MAKNAIILCSGGLDSSVTAHLVKKKLKYNSIIILFFNYGQNSLLAERKCAKKCALAVKAKFQETVLDLSYLKSSLTSSIAIKEGINLSDTKKESDKWYLPSRNLIFLAYAISFSESLFLKEKRKYDIFAGFKCEGNEPFPDASILFVKKMNSLASQIAQNKPRIIAPLIKKDKEDIILLGKNLGINFKNTFSCYASSSKHCGVCLACRLRKAGFYWSGVKDPTKYKS